MILEINNTESRTIGIPPAARDLLVEVLTYKNDIESELKNCYWKIKQCKFYSKSEKPEERERAKKTTEEMYAKIKKLKETEYVCLYQNDTFPTGLLNFCHEVLKATNTQYTVRDLRTQPAASRVLRWANKPWEPRYYQEEMIKLGIEHGRGVFVSAVGTGKSLIMAYLIKALSVTSLIVVPSVGLSEQLYNDFSIWFGAGNVQCLNAEKVRKIGRPKPINIITIQSLASLNKSGEIKEFLDEIEALYCDEIHHAGSDSYTDLLPYLNHIYHRFGFTGTFLRNDSKILELWSFLSNVLYEYPAWKAIKEGYLTPMEVRTFRMVGKAKQNYQKEYDAAYSNNKELLARLHNIYEIHEGQQILILVSKKDKVGLIIHEYLKILGIENTYISGDDKKEFRTECIKQFNEKKIKVLIGSSVISEGIDIRSTDVLANCKGGKSEIDLVQGCGRLIRLFDGKSIGIYYDFNFEGSNYMSKHYLERMESIKQNFNPTTIHENL